MELAIQRSLNCATPTGRETPIPDWDLQDPDEFPQLDNDSSPVGSPIFEEIEKAKEEKQEELMRIEDKISLQRPVTPTFANEIKSDPSMREDQGVSVKLPIKEENPDIQNMESSAAEALMTLAGQDNIIRHKDPGPVAPNIIRALQNMSSKYINDEPILKESEKIDMFSEIPTTDSEEESLEIRRLRLAIYDFACSIYSHF